MSDEKAEIERLAVLAEANEGDRALLPETYRRIVAFTLRHSAELAALRSKVERITRERDAMIQLCDQKAAERDAALEANERLRGQLAEARAKLKEVIEG